MLKKRLLLLGLVLVFCLVGQWVLSASQSVQATASQTPPPDWLEKGPSHPSQNLDHLQQNLVRQLLVMILIVALFGGGLWWFVRKYSKGLLVGKGKSISVIETVPLGPRKMLHLLDVGSKRLLIASTSDSIRLLADLTESAQPIPAQKECPQ